MAAAAPTVTPGAGSAPPETDVAAAPAAAAAEGTPEDLQSAAAAAPPAEEKRWPGWPGENAFRLIVPVMKVGAIIGHKGDHIKKLCEETRAKVRVLDAPVGTSDRIVLVSGKEEVEAEISPAMEAVLRIFNRINSIPESGAGGAIAPAVCSFRLLVASSQAINLIGKQGTSIKSIQEGSGATIRVITGDELPIYAIQDERVVDIQGETLKVRKALEAVIGHLRKFLVDHTVLRLFDKNLNSPATQNRVADPWGDKTSSLISNAQQPLVGNDFSIPKRESLYIDRESQLDNPFQRGGLSAYGHDPSLSGLRAAGTGRTPGALVTQITQTMRIPLSYAEDLIGVRGENIDYIRHNSGAYVTVLESIGVPDEITVEIKGSSTEIQAAQQLIEDILDSKRRAASSYITADPGLRPSYYGRSAYHSSYDEQPLGGGYGSSGFGGYGGYRY